MEKASGDVEFGAMLKFRQGFARLYGEFTVPCDCPYSGVTINVLVFDRKKQSSQRIECPIEKTGWGSVVLRPDRESQVTNSSNIPSLFVSRRSCPEFVQ